MSPNNVWMVTEPVAEEMLAAFDRIPEKIEDDIVQGKVNTFVGQLTTLLQLATPAVLSAPMN